MTDPALNYITIFLTSILGLFLAFVSFSFARLIKKYYKLKDDKENLEKNYKAQSEKIIAEARERAQQIVREATAVSGETKKEITAELQKVSGNQITQFRTLQDDIRNQILASFKNTTGQFEEAASSEIEKFQSNLREQTASSQGFLQKAIEEALVGIQKEVDEYKNARLKGAEDSIIEIIKLATKNFLGSSLTLNDHEKLVLSALEEAKKQNIFGDISGKGSNTAEVNQMQDNTKEQNVRSDN